MREYRQIVGAVFTILGAWLVYYFIFRPEPNITPAPSSSPVGWDDLSLCSELTSIDSKKTLSLREDFSASLKDNTGSGESVLSNGRWALIDAERHMYKIDIAGAGGIYVLVSPPDSDGCLLAAGPLNRVNLWRSWFSETPESSDQESEP